MSYIVMFITFSTLSLAISFLFSSSRQFVFAILDIINARPISAMAWPVEWLLDLCGGQASIAWENWFVDFVRNALLLRRTSPRWSVGANINFRSWQQVAKGWGSKTNKERGVKGEGRGVGCDQFPCSCCCCASRCLCVICQFTQILLALLDWNAKSNANLLRAWASWPPLPLPP